MREWLVIAVGGGLGAMLRYGLANLLMKYNKKFPLATFITNVVGSICLGLLLSVQTNTNVFLFAGVGFLGAFTTFSTFTLESVTLLERKKYCKLLFYQLSSYGVAIIGFFCSYLFGQLFFN